MKNPIIKYYPSGKIHYEEWYNQNGKLHRIDGPAILDYFEFEDVKIEREQWYLNGKLHREKDPAYIKYLYSGEIDYEEWWVNGNLHRTDGPAFIEYSESGKIEIEEWYLNGEDIYLDEWLKEHGYKWPLTEDQQTELLLTFV